MSLASAINNSVCLGTGLWYTMLSVCTKQLYINIAVLWSDAAKLYKEYTECLITSTFLLSDEKTDDKIIRASKVADSTAERQQAVRTVSISSTRG